MTNYFELYELPVSFKPDATLIKSKFYELSRRYHPDRAAQADAAAQEEALRMSALNNAAYKTLTDADATMAYILRLNGIMEEEEKYTLPPAFLMEMMDLNEIVSDYEMEQDNASLKEQANNMLHEQLINWQAEVAPLLDKHAAGDQSKELLMQLKDHYFRKKYLLRIQERMNTFASR